MTDGDEDEAKLTECVGLRGFATVCSWRGCKVVEMVMGDVFVYRVVGGGRV